LDRFCFRNQDIRARLTDSPFLRGCGCCVAKQPAKISRLLKRFHIYGLIAKYLAPVAGG
jgi:hypothetical protein